MFRVNLGSPAAGTRDRHVNVAHVGRCSAWNVVRRVEQTFLVNVLDVIKAAVLARALQYGNSKLVLSSHGISGV